MSNLVAVGMTEEDFSRIRAIKRLAQIWHDLAAGKHDNCRCETCTRWPDEWKAATHPQTVLKLLQLAEDRMALGVNARR